MDPTSHEHWHHLPRLFAQAVELTGGERDSFVESVGTRDPVMRAQLERLLRAHDDAGADFLQAIDPTHAAALLASTPEEEPPERIGQYAIVRRVGGGGMGVVYLAHDTRLNRPVALKLLRRASGEDQDANRRLLAEAQAASALDHPNTVPVHEVGEAPDGRGFIVMAYAGDTSLADRLRRGPLEILEAVELARQLAEALAAAHRLGIVHRDVKPSNVIISPEGRARLVDFGIAWIIGGSARNAIAGGTVSYMSPEQTRGDPVDHRTDVWSLGVVLYEMLTGRRPFSGENEHRLIQAIRHESPPSLSAVRPDVPEALGKLIERCLAKSPEGRPAGAEVVAAELVAFSRTAPVDSTPRGRRRRVVPLLAAAILLLAVAMLLSTMTQPRADTDPGTIVVLPFTAVTGDTALQRLGRELVVTLSSNLDVAAGLRAIAPITVLSQSGTTADLNAAGELARHLGAQRLVYGQLTRDGDAVRLDAGVYDANDLREHGRATAAGRGDDIAALTDSATLKLLVAAWPEREWPLPNVAALTTTSVAALRAYLEGEMALAGARFRAAPLAFARAIEADSTFWFAYWRYMYARDYHGLSVDSVIRAAVVAHRASLPEQDRMMVDVRMQTSQSAKLALRRAITDRFPTYWPAWFDLADQLTHHGVFLGHSFEEAHAALQRTVDLNPRFVPAWEHMFWLAVHERDTLRSGQALARLQELGVDSLLKGEWDLQTLDYYRYLDRLARNGGAASVEEATIGADVLAHYRGPLAPERLAVSLTNYGFFRAQLDLSRRVHTRAPPSAIGAAHDWGAALAWAGRGDWDSAFVALQRYTRSATHPRGPVWSFGLAAVGAWVGALDPALPLELRPAALRSPFSRSDDGRAELAWLDGLLACAQGNVAGLDSARATLLASGVPATPVLARSLHGLADTESTPATLLDAQTAVADGAWAFRHGADHPFVIAVDRISTARGLLASGDTATATRLLRLNETELPGTLQPLPAIHQVLATLTLDVLARSAEARGEAQRTQHYRALFAERTEGVLAPHKAIPASCTNR